MNTIEIVIYSVLAIIIFSLLLHFTISQNAGNIAEGVKEMFTGTPTSVTNEAFAEIAIAFWKECGLGMKKDSRALYFEGPDPLDRPNLFSHVEKIDLCASLQSADEGCGKQNHVDAFGTIHPKTVIRLTCDDTNHKLVIS